MFKKIVIEGETLIEDKYGDIGTVKDYLHDYVSNLFYIQQFPDCPGIIELNVEFKKVLDECGADTNPENWEQEFSPYFYAPHFVNTVTGEKL